MVKQSKAKQLSDKRVVGTSLLVSVGDVGLNLIVGLLTGSQTMFSQALQGTSDLVTASVLYVGVERSRRGPDEKHPLGYGREVFFWVLMAGMFMFTGTGLLSIYLGIDQVLRPEPLHDIGFAFAMLLFGFTTNVFAFSQSFIRLHRSGKGKAAWKHQLLGSSLVETKATFTLDLLGSFSALLGLLALSFYVISGDSRFDGLGSIMVGMSMMTAATILIIDVKSLIIGRTAPPETEKKIVKIVESNRWVNDVLDLRTIFIGSGKMLILVEVHLVDNLDTDRIEKILDRIKADLQREMPAAAHIQVEVETPDSELEE